MKAVGFRAIGISAPVAGQLRFSSPLIPKKAKYHFRLMFLL